jgi:hypothetical protein
MSVKRTNQQQNNKEKEEVYAIVDQELRDQAIKARDRILGYIDNYKGYVYSVTLGNGATLTTNSGDILDKYIKRYGKL